MDTFMNGRAHMVALTWAFGYNDLSLFLRIPFKRWSLISTVYCWMCIEERRGNLDILLLLSVRVLQD